MAGARAKQEAGIACERRERKLRERDAHSVYDTLRRGRSRGRARPAGRNAASAVREPQDGFAGSGGWGARQRRAGDADPSALRSDNTVDATGRAERDGDGYVIGTGGARRRFRRYSERPAGGEKFTRLDRADRTCENKQMPGVCAGTLLQQGFGDIV